MKGFWLRKVCGFIALAIIGCLVFGGIVMLLWNALMPELFHLPIISFWQALGLLILTKILFSGFRGGGPKSHWKHDLKKRWMDMTPEQREKFKQNWGNRCWGGRPGWGEGRGPGWGPETETNEPNTTREGNL